MIHPSRIITLIVYIFMLANIGVIVSPTERHIVKNRIQDAEATIAPSAVPSISPTFVPSIVPTRRPSRAPIVSPFPTSYPTSSQPTSQPTLFPSKFPTTSVPTVRGRTHSPTPRRTIAPSIDYKQYTTIGPYLDYQYTFSTLQRQRWSRIIYNFFNFQGKMMDSSCAGWESFAENSLHIFETNQVVLKNLTLFMTSYQYNTIDINKYEYPIRNTSYEYICDNPEALSTLLRAFRRPQQTAVRCNRQTWRINICQGIPILCINCAQSCKPNNLCLSNTSIALNPCVTSKAIPAANTLQHTEITQCDRMEYYVSNNFLYLDYDVISYYPRIKNLHTVPNSASASSVTVAVYTKHPKSFLNTTYLQPNTSMGYLYCSIVPISVKKLTSITQLQLYPTQYSSLAVNKSMSMTETYFTFDSLAPQTTYRIYCFTEDTSHNHKMPWKEVLNTTIATTSCCRKLFVENHVWVIPQYVPSINDPMNLHIYDPVYAFALNSIPSRRTSITLTLQGVTCVSVGLGPTTGVLGAWDTILSPLKFTVLPNATSLSLPFVIRGTTIGCYRITANVVAGGDYYAPSNISFMIRNFHIVPDLPNILSAQFMNDGQRIRILFDAATDQASTRLTTLVPGYKQRTTYFPCQLIATFANQNASNCIWENAKELQIWLSPIQRTGLNQLLKVYDRLIIKGGMIRAECVFSAANCNSFPYLSIKVLRILPPENPIAPLPSLLMAETITTCDDLVIDFSFSIGSSGRLWSKMDWKVYSKTSSANQTRIAALGKFLDGQTLLSDSYFGGKITVPRNYFSVGVYSIGFTVTNYWNLTAAIEKNVTIISRSQILPQVTLFPGNSLVSNKDASARGLGGLNLLPVHKPLRIHTSVSWSTCSAYTVNNMFLTYQWRLFQGVLYQASLPSQTDDSSSFYLSPNTLTAFENYTVTLTLLGVSTSDPTKRQIELKTASYHFYTTNSGVVAIINGGRTRTVLSSNEILCDASVSFSFENTTATLDASYSYLWECKVITPYFGRACPEQSSWTYRRARATLVIPQNTLQYDRYEITVHIYNAYGERYFTSQEIIVSNNLEYLTYSIDYSPLLSTVKRGVLPGMSYTDGYVLTPREESYSVLNATISMKNFLYSTFNSLEIMVISADSDVILSDESVSVQYSPFNNLLLYQIKFSPAWLGQTALNTYQFVVNYGNPTSYYNTPFMNMHLLTTNRGPYGGHLVVNPRSGNAYTTLFTLQSLSWTAEIDCYPLSYTYSYTTNISIVSMSMIDSTYVYAGKDYQELMLMKDTFSNSIQSYLGNGYDRVNYVILTKVIVTDIYATTNTDTFLFSVSAAVSPSFALTTGLTTWTRALTMQNNDTILQTMTAVMPMVKNYFCRVPVACNLLNRFDCTNSIKTCGLCYEGYIGLVGEGNTLCALPQNVSKTIFGIGHSCNQNTSCISQYCNRMTKTCQHLPKSCINSCSNQGYCYYTKFIHNPTVKNQTEITDTCYESDATCKAQCFCNTGNFGKACEYTFTTFPTLIKLKALALQTLLTVSYPVQTPLSSFQVMQYVQNIIDLLDDTTFLLSSPSALEYAISLFQVLLRDHLVTLCHSEEEMTLVIKVFSQMMNIPKASFNKFELFHSMLLTYMTSCSNILPYSTTVSSINPVFRMFSMAQAGYYHTLAPSTTYSLPLSSYELGLNAVPNTISIAIPSKLSRYAIQLTGLNYLQYPWLLRNESHLIPYTYLYTADTNPYQAMRQDRNTIKDTVYYQSFITALTTLTISVSSQSVDGSSTVPSVSMDDWNAINVTVQLPYVHAIHYMHIPTTNFTIYCNRTSLKKNAVEVIHEQDANNFNVTCPTGLVINVTCPSDFFGYYDIQCPGYQVYPTCNMLFHEMESSSNSVSNIGPLECTVKSYTKDNVTCDCQNLFSNPVVSFSTGISSFTVYSSLMNITLESVRIHYTLFPKDIPIGENDFVLIALSVVSGVSLLVWCFSAIVWWRQVPKKPKRQTMKPVKIFSVQNIEEIIPYELQYDIPWYIRYVKYVLTYHSLIRCFALSPAVAMQQLHDSWVSKLPIPTLNNATQGLWTTSYVPTWQWLYNVFYFYLKLSILLYLSIAYLIVLYPISESICASKMTRSHCEEMHYLFSSTDQQACHWSYENEECHLLISIDSSFTMIFIISMLILITFHISLSFIRMVLNVVHTMLAYCFHTRTRTAIHPLSSASSPYQTIAGNEMENKEEDMIQMIGADGFMTAAHDNEVIVINEDVKRKSKKSKKHSKQSKYMNHALLALEPDSPKKQIYTTTSTSLMSQHLKDTLGVYPPSSRWLWWHGAILTRLRRQIDYALPDQECAQVQQIFQIKHMMWNYNFMTRQSEQTIFATHYLWYHSIGRLPTKQLRNELATIRKEFAFLRSHFEKMDNAEKLDYVDKITYLQSTASTSLFPSLLSASSYESFELQLFKYFFIYCFRHLPAQFAILKCYFFQQDVGYNNILSCHSQRFGTISVLLVLCLALAVNVLTYFTAFLPHYATSAHPIAAAVLLRPYTSPAQIANDHLIAEQYFPVWYDLIWVLIIQEFAIMEMGILFWKYILVIMTVNADFYTQFQHVKERLYFIYMRSTKAITSTSTSYIQYFNPICRIARAFPQYFLSRLLFSLHDFDLILTPQPYTNPVLHFLHRGMFGLLWGIVSLPMVWQEFVYAFLTLVMFNTVVYVMYLLGVAIAPIAWTLCVLIIVISVCLLVWYIRSQVLVQQVMQYERNKFTFAAMDQELFQQQEHQHQQQSSSPPRGEQKTDGGQYSLLRHAAKAHQQYVAQQQQQHHRHDAYGVNEQFANDVVQLQVENDELVIVNPNQLNMPEYHVRAAHTTAHSTATPTTATGMNDKVKSKKASSSSGNGRPQFTPQPLTGVYLNPSLTSLGGPPGHTPHTPHTMNTAATGIASQQAIPSVYTPHFADGLPLPHSEIRIEGAPIPATMPTMDIHQSQQAPVVHPPSAPDGMDGAAQHRQTIRVIDSTTEGGPGSGGGQSCPAYLTTRRRQRLHRQKTMIGTSTTTPSTDIAGATSGPGETLSTGSLTPRHSHLQSRPHNEVLFAGPIRHRMQKLHQLHQQHMLTPRGTHAVDLVSGQVMDVLPGGGVLQPDGTILYPPLPSPRTQGGAVGSAVGVVGVGGGVGIAATEMMTGGGGGGGELLMEEDHRRGPGNNLPAALYTHPATQATMLFAGDELQIFHDLFHEHEHEKESSHHHHHTMSHGNIPTYTSGGPLGGIDVFDSQGITTTTSQEKMIGAAPLWHGTGNTGYGSNGNGNTGYGSNGIGGNGGNINGNVEQSYGIMIAAVDRPLVSIQQLPRMVDDRRLLMTTMQSDGVMIPATTTTATASTNMNSNRPRSGAKTRPSSAVRPPSATNKKGSRGPAPTNTNPNTNNTNNNMNTIAHSNGNGNSNNKDTGTGGTVSGREGDGNPGDEMDGAFYAHSAFPMIL